MSLTTSASLVQKAREGHYAVPAVNTSGGDYDIVRAVTEVAEAERSPMILMAYAGNAAYQGLDYAAVVMRHFAEKAAVPVAVHLDHATDEADIRARSEKPRRPSRCQ